MRAVAYFYRGSPGVGILGEDGRTVRPLALANAADGVIAIVEAQASGTPLPEPGEALALDEVELRAPIPRPRRNVFCVGKNYFAHAHEFAKSGFDSSAAAGAVPEDPIVFSKLPECVIANGASIEIDPAISSAVDYEAELAVIIGKGGRNIPATQALDHVWGYTIVNDVTARDLQGRHKQWLLGKSQDTYCPMGPVAVTADEIDLGATQVRCWVNDELRQDASTGQLIFDVPTLIATISAGITLVPGDIIATGTPEGVGIGFDPPKYLQAGDRVRVEISGIGALENPVVVNGAGATS
jgi:2-keto-4-pentenoate hydratase/2-oxohepta-3-ene-1,7-dioic acid hydratase in catechol pathway